MQFEDIFKKVKAASVSLSKISTETINKVLLFLADEAEQQIAFLLEENKKDLDLMSVNDPKFDRLKLSEQRIKDIAADIRNVATLPSPLGKILSEKQMPNGLKISKITVPLGVIGIIYEARPNVTFDVFALCFKAGNACVLKGGSDAKFSNAAIISIIKKSLIAFGLNEFIAELLLPEREATAALLTARNYVDVIIPRGSKALIDYVADNARIPVIETGAGIVHVFVDETADVEMAAAIINNSKTRRVSVCNALDCVIVHEKQIKNLVALVKPLAETNVVIYADDTAYKTVENNYPAHLLEHSNETSYGTEFLDYKLAIKTVANIDEALQHIYQFGSKHSESIVSNDVDNIARFLNEVDAAAVYSNASTAFTDGAQFGLGAEIGISTQKLHARGPMALDEIVSYKWVIEGSGQVRK
jgi:glutamate-5-semialdehyde dehydrogenase